MSASANLPAFVLRAARPATSEVVYWSGVLTLTVAAALFGGMTAVMLVLAVALGAYTWRHPEEALGASLLFLFAVQILLPSSARFKETDLAPQLYVWATGLLIITAGAVTRLKLKRLFDVPLSAIAFVAVALLSALYAQTHGAATSYVIRQFYGILLLVVFLGIALHAGDEELLLRRARTFGPLCALCFVVYYLAIFQEHGFHRETGTHGSQAAMLAILVAIAGLYARKLLWVLSGFVMMVVPALLFMRRDVLAFVVAFPIALAFRSRTWKGRLAYGCLAAVLALPGVFPEVARVVADQAREIPVLETWLPPTTEEAISLTERRAQTEYALNAVQKHPWLGEGLGSSFEWESPFYGYQEGGYVDSGWAYLFQKTGLLGAGAFLWFLITICTGFSRESAGLAACLLAAAVVIMYSEPVFFHFTTAPFLGAFAGLLLAKKRRKANLRNLNSGGASRVL
jgi:hypothetical protein